MQHTIKYISLTVSFVLLSACSDSGDPYAGTPHMNRPASGQESSILSPFSGQVFVNELMAGNDGDFVDEYAEQDDWIELYNDGLTPVSLAGWRIGDSEVPDAQLILTQDAVIPAQDFFIIWADDQPEQGFSHGPFKLSKDGETIWLFDDRGLLVQSTTYVTLTDGQSFGRGLDGGYGLLSTATPSATNSDTRPSNSQPTPLDETPSPEPDTETQGESPGADDMEGVSTSPMPIELIYINELVAKNSGEHLDENGDNDDWIELHNAGNETVNLRGWRIGDTEDPTEQHQFDEDIAIPAGEFLVLWADNESDQGALHLNFKLSKDGESIWLYDEVGNEVDTLTFEALEEGISFGRLADGSHGVLDDASPGQVNGQ